MNLVCPHSDLYDSHVVFLTLVYLRFRQTQISNLRTKAKAEPLILPQLKQHSKMACYERTEINGFGGTRLCKETSFQGSGSFQGTL